MTPTVHPNAQLVYDQIEASHRGDLEAARATMSDDIVFHVAGRSALAGDHHGPDAFFTLFGTLLELTGGTYRYESLKVVADENHAVTIATAAAERSGKAWRSLHLVLASIVEGKVAEAWVVEEDLYGFDELLA